MSKHYYVPSTVVGTGDRTMNKIGGKSYPRGIYNLVGEK